MSHWVNLDGFYHGVRPRPPGSASQMCFGMMQQSGNEEESSYVRRTESASDLRMKDLRTPRVIPRNLGRCRSFNNLDLHLHSAALGPFRRNLDNHVVAALQPAGGVLVPPLVILVVKAVVCKRLCVGKRTENPPVNIGDRNQVTGDGPRAGIPNRLQRVSEWHCQVR